ncbi:Serpin B10 [Halotydeus destructor]|nr:Serpin B10 [Halotydeus destructor]
MLVTAMEQVRRVSFRSSLNAFGFCILKRLKSEKSCVVSPPSFATLLAILEAGATGETLKQVRHVYAENHIPDTIPEELRKYANRGFSQSTRILVAQDLEVCETYSDFLEVVDLHLEKVDFRAESEEICAELNSWVHERSSSDTGEAVKSVDPSSQMIVLNAVCFKDFWKSPFTACESRVFNNMPTPPEAFITTEGFYAVHERDDFGVVRIPYESFTGSLYVIMPQNERKMEDLTFKILNRLVDGSAAAESKHIKLSLPMFKVDKSFNIGRLLRSLGVRDAFDPDKAEFGRMVDSGKMCVSDMTQRIAFSINSHAAAPSVPSAGGPLEEWIFDRPFAFVVRDDQTDTHLISGFVENLRLE